MILAAPPSARVWPYRTLAALLIVGVAVARLVYLVRFCPLDLAPDEAHYWDWSRHLDWSYYSKGPLVACLIRAACELCGPWALALTGTEIAAVRIPAVLCGSLLLTSLYVLTVQVQRSDRLALGVVALALTLPVINAGGLLMTIDAPYTCLWGWALVFGHHAVFRGPRWAWVATGICVALGILAKQTMVLWVPCLGLFCLCTPAYRRLLPSLDFWLLAGIGALGALPMLLWNAGHGWVTFKHVELHASDRTASLRPLGPLNYVAMQCLLLLGFWFVGWARALWAERPTRQQNPEHAYLWWMSLPVFAFFGLFSIKNGGGEPNWPVTAYLSGIVLAAGWLAGEFRHPNPLYRRLALGSAIGFCILGAGLSVVVHNSALIQPLLVAIAGKDQPGALRRLDPTCRLRGWRYLAGAVDRLRKQVAYEEGTAPVLAGSWWIYPGELGFYCAGHPDVYSVGLALADRHSQYDLWHPNPLDEPDAYRGRTFLVVGVGPEVLRDAFEEVGPGQPIVYREAGQEIASWVVTVARGYKGFPQRTGSGHY